MRPGRTQFILAIAIAALGWCPLSVLAADSSGTVASVSLSKDDQHVFEQVLQLVKEFYPKAKITKENNTIHFEHKVKMELEDFSNKEIPVPQSGGIIGDISVQAGQYNGPDKSQLNCEKLHGFHTVLLMAPYSSQENAHMLAKLDFSCDVPFEFKHEFKHILKNFSFITAGSGGASNTVSTVPGTSN